MIVKAIAPARILDFGGWTDTWFAKHGRVLNFAVDLHAKVVIVTREKPGASIVAQDYGEAIEILDPSQILYDGKHDLLKAALNVTEVDGVDISVYSDVPPGCGTGSSATVMWRWWALSPHWRTCTDTARGGWACAQVGD